MDRNRAVICALALSMGGCKCGTPSLGALNEPAPADLGSDGLIVDQPANGTEVRGGWVAVTGWFDPSKVQLVTIVGAPNPDFYLPTGHQGIASVQVQQRKDGRFIAPRVPVAEGATKIRVLGMMGPKIVAGVDVAVVGSKTTEIPATVGTVRAIAVVSALATQMVAADEFARTRAVMVADGDEVKIFDAQLKPIATLKGLSRPTGMAGDDQGRFYVADTGNNRVARFTSGGQLDTTIAGPVDAGFQSPSSLGLGYVGTKGGVEPVLFVLDAGGRLTACRIGLETLCVPITTQTMDGFVIPPGWLAGETCDGLDAPTHVWARAGQVLYRVGTGSRIALPPVNGLRDFTGSFDQLTPYWAAIDGKGQLLEWASTPSNTRRSSLPTQASALALDEGASAYLHDRDVGEGAAVGPLVLYVGSPGTIERRVAPALEVIR